MARMPRAVLPGVAHHVTQRGVIRQTVFWCRSDYKIYLELVRDGADRCGVPLIGYCLMPNHVHWVVVAPELDSLQRVFGEAHSRYAHYANAKLNRRGHFWQGRFFSCALDRSHLWAALRYIERNPVRAGLVDTAEDWEWSSAAVHAGRDQPPEWLATEQCRAAYTCDQWQIYLAVDKLTEADLIPRSKTYSGRPIGSDAFVEASENTLGRPLRIRKAGRRPRQAMVAAAGSDPQQETLFG